MKGRLCKTTPFTEINRILSLPPETRIRLYSYQGQPAWDAAKKRGYWTGEGGPFDDDLPQWVTAYDWMRRQMRNTVPNFSGDLPMWAWLKRPSFKPSLRKHHVGSLDCLRLTADVPLHRIVFSCYDDWHGVLNGWYMANTEKEDDEFDARRLTADALKEAKEASWKRCLSFESAPIAEERDWTGRNGFFQVQACVDRFYWDEIVNIRRFPKKESPS